MARATLLAMFAIELVKLQGIRVIVAMAPLRLSV
jgi:hypothetical protein